MHRIEAKTAALLAACCDIGAVVGVLPDVQRSALHSYGRLLGLAFQIADDVLDYLGSEGELGKPIGKDIAEGFATLPLMVAMEDGPTAARLKKVLHDGRKLGIQDALAVAEIVRESRAPQRALAQAEDFARQASAELSAIEAGQARDALTALTDYVVSRKL
jgi:geranylgeranyl pyrophosphate synthase